MGKTLTILAGLLSFAAASLLAQSKQADRVTAQPESTPLVRLAGHLPRWATPAMDAGPVPDDTPLTLTFVLSRAPQQQAAFLQLLADQQDPASPCYHQWLTPQQVGEFFGPTLHDIDAFTAWLASRGLPAAEVSASRLFVTVNGPASAVADALSSSFHNFLLNGEPRLSTTQEPALPAAFAGIVQSIAGLSNTPILPMGHGQGVPVSSAAVSGAQPRYTFTSQTHYITPGDFATIFDLNPAINSGLSGVGQRIAIVGVSRVVDSDITEFEANTGLAKNLPTTIVPGAGPDPGYPGGDAQLEATLDVERALGTAPSAQADLVILPDSSSATFTAAQFAVNTLNDPILNISFSTCEIDDGPAIVYSWDTLFSQAASQGISVVVSSGDSGAAACDEYFATTPASQQRSINSICASSYITCVGGTEFSDSANPSLYWSSSNSSTMTSALGYIPEGAWNEPSSAPDYYFASGGGASIYIPKPSWQTGVGVPADGARDVPDVSFPSAIHDAYYGCYALGSGNCASNQFEYFYGTSNAAPSMAAVTALVNQRTGTRQGNINPSLYRLAGNPANGVFHDATVASSGVTGCSVSIPSMCNNSTPSPISLSGGLAGYLLAPGYDLATGWGSLDVNNLLTALGPPQAPTAITLSASSPFIYYLGNSNSFTAAVYSPNPGTPTGFVQFFLNGVMVGSAVPLPASGNAVSPAITFTVAGNNTISAIYSGDASFAVAKAPSLSLYVDNPGFSIAASPSALTLRAGATTGNSVTLTYTSLGGFNGAINQSCTVTYNGSGTPGTLPTCSFTAPSVTVPSGGTVSGTITIASTAPGAGGSASVRIDSCPACGPSLHLPAKARNTAALSVFPRITLASLFIGLLSGRRRSRTSLGRPLAMAAAIAIAFASLSGCAGRSNSSTMTGSAPGSYTITITSSSGSIPATPTASISLTLY